MKWGYYMKFDVFVKVPVIIIMRFGKNNVLYIYEFIYIYIYENIKYIYFHIYYIYIYI